MPDSQLLRLFGVQQYLPQDIHRLKDRIFSGVTAELMRNGWNCNSAVFGASRRDTCLMEMVRRGFSLTVDQLIGAGADVNYNTHGYGDSTALMAARDPEVMKKLLNARANPMEVNAHHQTDFAYKLLSGQTAGARFYLYNTEKIPLQSLLDNFRDCLLTRGTASYNPMFPLCILPVVPNGVPYKNIIDKPLLDSMFRNQCLPFSPGALNFQVENGVTAWQYLRMKMKEEAHVTPALLVAWLACMSRADAFRGAADFACVEEYIGKPLPHEVQPVGTISKALFVYMLFSLGSLPPAGLLRWLLLLGRVIRHVALWMDILGEEPFRVTSASRPSENHRGETHVLQELSILQSLLSLRVNVPDSFGEFSIPGGLSAPAPSPGVTGVKF